MNESEVELAPEPDEVPDRPRELSSSPKVTTLGSFRVLSAALDSHIVWQELRTELVCYAVIWRSHLGQVLWYTFPVTDELLERLRVNKGVPVQVALGLQERKGKNFKVLNLNRVAGELREFLSEPRPSTDDYGAIVDESGQVYGVYEGSIMDRSLPSSSRQLEIGEASEPTDSEDGIEFEMLSVQDSETSSLDRTEGVLFPTLTALGSIESTGINPNERAEFEVRLPAFPSSGVTTPLPVVFDQLESVISIEAVVSSKDFIPPSPSDWATQLIVDRHYNCRPSAWVFPAIAIGDRPYYSLTVTFHTAGNVSAALTYVLKRAGMALQSIGVLPSQKPIQPMVPPIDFAMDRLIVEITEQGWDQCRIRLLEGLNEWGKVNWTLPKADYFDQLGQARSFQEIIDTGYGLTVNLPSEVREFLDRPEVAGIPTIFLSNSRIAPFEIIQLQPSSNGPFLGIDRPVSRWSLKKTTPSPQTYEIQRIVCIRPAYTPPDDLPSAKGEEDDLFAAFGKIDPVRSTSELLTHLNNNEPTLLHFAGHARGNPAELTLEHNEKFPAVRFHPSKPLLKHGPVFFMNGCRIGSAAAAAPSSIANFIEILVDAGCGGVIASAIAIDSPAARRAAKAFYDAASTQTVANAVRQIRMLCQDSTCLESQKATYMSYMVFCDPDLRLAIA